MIRRSVAQGNGVVHEVFRASLAIAISAIVMLSIGASAVGYHFLHKQTVEHLHSLATLTALQSQAAVLFEDSQNATELLRAIPAAGGVQHAELRDGKGRLLAEYGRSQDYLLAKLANWMDAEVVTEAVLVEGRVIGHLVLVGSNDPLANALAGLIVSDLVVAVLTTLLSILLGAPYTRRITHPLTQLRTVMRKVIEEGDFSRRAPAFSLAEAEELGTEFNELLDEIAKRDHDLKQANDALERLAFRDMLTGLPNRAMFDRAIDETLKEKQGAGGAVRVGMLYLDVDDFKAINDVHGHEAGDRVLAAIGDRLHAWLPEDAMAARLGGDEFVVIISPFGRERRMRELVDGLRAELEAPLRTRYGDLTPILSIGSAVFPDDASSADGLMRAADEAMYAQKRRRRRAHPT